MKETGKLRRDGYAPLNPELGRRGLHTREFIVSTAARLFLDHGFHGTSVGAIAEAAGGSRATVYQYFEDKDAIYRELAARCAPALIEHSEGLGLLAPTAEGVYTLHAWLQRWTTLFDEHAAVLLNFAGQDGVGSTQPAPDTLTDHYIETVTDRIRSAGLTGLRPEDAAAAVVRVVYMVNLYRYRGMFDLPDASTITASLSVAVQLLLFPYTPSSAFAAIAEPDRITASPLRVAAVPATDARVAAPQLSPVRSDIVAAASALFAQHGYFAVAMDDIAATADVSRRTLYRHFSAKVDILSELTQWAVVEAAGLATDLQLLGQTKLDRDALHAWLGRYVRFHRSYGSVITTWYDGGLNVQLADAVSAGLGPFHAAATALLERSGLPDGIDLRVGTASFLAVLGRMTDLTILRRTDETHYQTADLMLTVLTRMLGLQISDA